MWPLVALLGSGGAWAVHLLASYAVVSVGCVTGWEGTRPALGVLTLACAALAIATGVLTLRRRRAAVTSARFTLDVGAGLAALFTALIVLAGIVPLIVPVCGAG
jgi:hypothetical protein